MIYVFYLITKRAALKKAKNAKELFICPKCGSADLTYAEDLPAGTVFLGAISSTGKMLCNDCDYEGMAPQVDKDKVEDFRKNLKSSKRKKESSKKVVKKK